MRYKQYNVGFGRCNANVCKRHKNKQREEPAVLDGINNVYFDYVYGTNTI